jgi:hypothetical protein
MKVTSRDCHPVWVCKPMHIITEKLMKRMKENENLTITIEELMFGKL